MGCGLGCRGAVSRGLEEDIMVRATREITESYDKCDYCENEAGDTCAVCGHSMCEDHVSENPECNSDDGDICKACEALGYTFDQKNKGEDSLSDILKNGEKYKGEDHR